MVASALTEEEAIQNLPKGLSKGEAREAWEKRESFAKALAEGKTTYDEIGPPIHLTKKGFAWLLTKISKPDPNPVPDSPPDPTAESHAENPPNVQGGNPPPAQPSPVGANPPSSPPAARTPVDRAQMAAQLESMDLSNVGAPAGKSPFAGTIEMPDMYARLADVCRLMGGMTPEKAKGVAVSFAYTAKNAADYTRLYQILIGMGQARPMAEAIVSTWQGMNSSPSEGASTFTGEAGGTAKLEDVERRLGLKPGANPEETEIERLDREERSLRVQKARLELDAQKRELGLSSPGAAGGEDEEGYEEVMLNINGMPSLRRIKSSKLPMYAQFIVKAPGAAGQGGEEMPPWAKAIMEEQAASRREREEDRKRAERAEELRQALAPLYEQNKKLEERLAAGTGGETDTAKELRLMREAREKDKTDDIKSQLAGLRQDVANATTPEGLRAAQDRYMQGARQFGLVPKSEVGLLTEEQIALDGERKAVTRKDQMTGDLMEVAKTKLQEQGPLRKIGQSVADAGVGREIIDFAKQKLNATGGGPKEEMVPPTDAEYLETAKQLEAAAEAAGERPPRPAEKPPEGVA